MSMRKKFILIIALVFTLTGCSNTKHVETVSTSPGEEIEYGDLRDYMRDHFEDFRPHIAAKIDELGYDANNLECMFIWSESNIECPRLVFANEYVGVNVLKFSWRDYDYYDFNDQDYSCIYSTNDLNYVSLDDAFEGYVNDLRIPHIYEVWSFAKPEFESKFEQLGYDVNNLKCCFLGETVPDGYTMMFVNQSGYLDSIIWFWDGRPIANDDRYSGSEYKLSDCEYNSIQEAFDGFCAEYW